MVKCEKSDNVSLDLSRLVKVRVTRKPNDGRSQQTVEKKLCPVDKEQRVHVANLSVYELNKCPGPSSS